MAHIIIAGRPCSEETAECILLAENLSVHFPSVKFIKVLKHTDEWEEYSEQICNLYGFERKTHPLIFYSSGNFIGNKENFFKLVACNFKNLSFLSDDGQLLVENHVIDILVQEQIKSVNEEHFTRINGTKISEEVKNKFLNLQMNKDNLLKYNTLDCSYSKEFLLDMIIYVKYSNKYNPRNDDFHNNSEALLEGIIEIEVESEIPQESYKKTIESQKSEEFDYNENSQENQEEIVVSPQIMKSHNTSK